jgi:ATP-dependent exoDNAse (exonuclease V) alpha subunit
MNTKNDAEANIYNGQLGWIKEIVSQKGFHYENEQSRLALKQAQERGVDHSISDDLLSAADDLLLDVQKRQEEERQRNKIAGFLGNAVMHTSVNESQQESGTNKRMASHSITVAFDNPDGTEELVTLSTSAQIENLLPAWCITAHKSQGSGFRKVFIILHDAGGKLLVNELLYTAITRAIEAVTIMTTPFAFAKALKNFNMPGSSLSEKLSGYIKRNNIDLVKEMRALTGLQDCFANDTIEAELEMEEEA